MSHILRDSDWICRDCDFVLRETDERARTIDVDMLFDTHEDMNPGHIIMRMDAIRSMFS